MLQHFTQIRRRDLKSSVAADPLNGTSIHFEAESRPPNDFSNPDLGRKTQLIGLQRYFKLLTEWAELTAREKTGQKREKTTSGRALEVNSAIAKSPLFQGTLAESPPPERQSLPTAVGGRGGFELSVPNRTKVAGWWGVDKQTTVSK
jgi:hypothetical protein